MGAERRLERIEERVERLETETESRDQQLFLKMERITTIIESLDGRVRKLEEAIYGNTRGSLISRVSIMETRLDSIAYNMRLLSGMVAGTFLGILIAIIRMLLG